jgi:hypothetical protein
VNVYDSYHSPGSMVFGGTSVSAQIVSAIYGLVGSGASDASAFYSAGLHDVVAGSNGQCTGHGRNTDPSLAYLCTAQQGYDGPTGMGTPNGTAGF